MKNSIIFAEVEDWNIEDVVLRENEILINKPFNSLIGANNSQIVEDEYGFKYRKAYTTQKEKDAIFWKSLISNNHFLLDLNYSMT